MPKQEEAVELLSKGYNCAQSALGAFSEQLGLDQETALKMASGFGGGIHHGEICGAVTGAVMAIGLKCGYFKEGDIKQKGLCDSLSNEFVERFTKENGSILCRDLLDVDVRSPSDFTTPEVRELFKTVCPEMVASASAIVQDLLSTGE